MKTVVAIGEDLAAAGLTAAQLGKVGVVYLGTHANATSAAAKVVIPTLTVFEKSGTFINQQFRIQKFAQAVPGPQGVADDLRDPGAAGRRGRRARRSPPTSTRSGPSLAAEVPASPP